MATIVRMWSGPRNMSTAMMRSWDSRADTTVMDEPLYAYYLDQTGLDHPARSEILLSGPTELREAISRCGEPDLDGESVISFQKHMSHHLLPETALNWVNKADEHRVVNAILLRHPRRVIASYARVRSSPTVEDLGFPQLRRLVDEVGPLPIVETDRFLAEPELGLRSLCHQLDVSYDPAMLTWAKGPRPSDGVWAPHWYGAVEKSTEFSPAPDDDADQIPLPVALETVASEAQALYELLLDP